jgi:hypothetical protein
MASGDRFYELELRHRPAFWGDVGSLLKIEGLVVGGEGTQAILLLPDCEMRPSDECFPHRLTPDQWSEWLRLSDNPEVLVMPGKAFHRKLRYEISGAVQQKVIFADECKCRYCGVSMGKAQLTMDHFRPLETGGKNDTSNLLSACRACNKSKGSMSPEDWCKLRKLDFDSFVDYLEKRKLP